MNFLPAEISINNIKDELAGFNDAFSDYGMDGGRREGGRIKKEEEQVWEPPLWQQQYDNIRNMRSKRDAPVDKYGCFMNAETDVSIEVRRILAGKVIN